MIISLKHWLNNLFIRVLMRVKRKQAKLIDIFFRYKRFPAHKSDAELQEISGSSARISPLHLYGGYAAKDLTVLQSCIVQKAEMGNNFFTDGFSQITLLKSVPFCKKFNIERLSFPVPDDGFHAEALEYVAICDSIRRAGESYCIAELGAGWGPWISLGGVIARNREIRNITLIGVEASPERFALMKDQLRANKLFPNVPDDSAEMSGIRCRLLQGAVWPIHKTLWFSSADKKDMGAAAVEQGADRDYLGRILNKTSVDGFTLKEILDDAIVDLLHIDIQGAEFDVVDSSIDILDSQVKSMMIGTHSRTIEGKLIELLYKHGWYLHREKPCRVEWGRGPVSLEAMTVTDGCQYWRR